MMTRSICYLATFLVIVSASISGCAAPEEVAPEPQQTPSGSENLPPTDELNPRSAQVVYPSGWGEIVINANYAKTTVTVGAHFATTRNACGRDAYGGIDLATWNALAQNANLALQSEPNTSEEYCVDPPADALRWMDGTVDIKLPQANGTLKTRTLYEARNGLICSTIRDKTVSDALLGTINQMVLIADKEDCPNGWGS